MEELNKPMILLWNAPQNIRHSVKIFNQEEIQKIFDSVKASKDYWKRPGYNHWGVFQKMRDLTLVSMIYYLALRPGEGCSLKQSDIDFQNKKVFICGLNNKERKDRLIPLPKQLLPILEEYLSFPKMYWKNSDYLFPSFRNGQGHLSTQRLKHIMREKILKPSGLYIRPSIEQGHSIRSCQTTTYSLRKSRASQLLSETKDLFLVSNFLGHADVRTTAQYYIHCNEEYSDYMQKAADGDISVMKEQKIINQNVEINQTNNITVVLQQMQVIIQQQKEMIDKLMQAQTVKTSASNPLILQEKPLPLE